MTLPSFCGCACRFESYLVANPKTGFLVTRLVYIPILFCETSVTCNSDITNYDVLRGYIVFLDCWHWKFLLNINKIGNRTLRRLSLVFWTISTFIREPLKRLEITTLNTCTSNLRSPEFGCITYAESAMYNLTKITGIHVHVIHNNFWLTCSSKLATAKVTKTISRTAASSWRVAMAFVLESWHENRINETKKDNKQYFLWLCYGFTAQFGYPFTVMVNTYMCWYQTSSCTYSVCL